VIDEYEAAGKKPTTFNIAAEVYRVRRDQHGHHLVSDAQQFATGRALAALARKGLVTGHEHLELARSTSNGRSEPCCFWSMVRSDLPLERSQRLADAHSPAG